MSARDYLSGIRPCRADSGEVTEAPWDPELAPALWQHRSTVPEEHVAEQRLSDLQAPRQMFAASERSVIDPFTRPVTMRTDLEEQMRAYRIWSPEPVHEVLVDLDAFTPDPSGQRYDSRTVARAPATILIEDGLRRT
jgi:hypothetical protein